MKDLRPAELLEAFTRDRTLLDVLDEDLARIQSLENRKLVLGLLAGILTQGGLEEGTDMCSTSGYSSGSIQGIAAEVEPKNYPPGEMITDVPSVMRALARIINSLAAGSQRDALAIAQRISWNSLRQAVLIGICGTAVRNGDAQTAENIEAQLTGGPAAALPNQLRSEGAVEDEDNLKAEIEQVLSEIIPPGATFPLSHAVIEVTVEHVNVSRGEAQLNIGACRFVEGSQLAPFLEQEIKKRLPQIQSVVVDMAEI